MKKLEVKNLSISLSNKIIIKDINLYVNTGEFVSIIGSSGSGKSTLFNAITGIIPVNKGEILLNNTNITGETGKISYMLQKDLLLPFKKVKDNIALPLILKGYSKEEAYKKFNKYIDIFDIRDLLDKYPNSLSGGQRQRVALLRTIMFSDDINLLDEPFSALDLITKSKIHKWYNEIRSKFNLTTLLITHDIDEAILLSDRIYILKNNTLIKEFKIDLSNKRENTNIDFINIKKEIISYL